MKTQIPRNTKFLRFFTKLFYLNHLIFLVVKYPHANYVLVTEGTAVTIQKRKHLNQMIKSNITNKRPTDFMDLWMRHPKNIPSLLTIPALNDKLILITRKSKQTQTEGQSIKFLAYVFFRNTNLN